MKKVKDSRSFTIHLFDSSRNKDVSLHRQFKRWLPLVEEELYSFMSSPRGLKLKKQEMASVDLYLTWCGEHKIKRLNRDYRAKDKITDVLSFPLYQSLRLENRDRLYSPYLELGDVVICLPVARRQSIEFEVSVVEEIIHQLVHGFLHLVGFDHERGGKEEELMFSFEEKLVEKIYCRYRK